MSEPHPGVRRIAVLRANRIGDFVFSLPALQALRAAYPHAEIVLLGAAWHVGFLSERPGPVDRVIAVPPSRGVNDLDGAAASEVALDSFFARMRDECFDLALQMHGGGRWSNPFTLRLGARLTAGLRAEDAPPLDRWVRYVYYQPEILRYLEVVGLVGAPPVTVEPSVAVTAADLLEADAALGETTGDIVVLHPGASDPRRRWPAHKFAAVGDALAAEGGSVVVIGTGPEADVVRSVVEGMRFPPLALVDRLGLGGLAALLSRASLLVANDSGPLHLANAVGTPTVGVFWCGNLVNGAPAYRQRHRPVASFRLACPVCGVDCTTARCEHSASFVADVRLGEVLCAARDLLGARGDQ